MADGVLGLHQAAQQRHFAVAQADFGFVLALRNHRLIQPPQRHRPADVRNFDQNVQGQFVVSVHVRSHIHVYPDLGEAELRAHQRADANRPDARLEAPRCIRHFIADSERNLLSIRGPDLRRLHHARLVVGHHRLQQSARQGDRNVVQPNRANFKHRNRTAAGR